MKENKMFCAVFCSYAPLAVIHAAGFVPYRVFPFNTCPDQAGGFLHDNLCPNVKFSLNRAIGGDVPDFKAAVFTNGCDAMRRLRDAWEKVRPGDRIFMIDLPVEVNKMNTEYFASQVREVFHELCSLAGNDPDPQRLWESIGIYNELKKELDRIESVVSSHKLSRVFFQEVLNRSVTEDPESLLEELKQLDQEDIVNKSGMVDGVPVLVFGNVMQEIEIVKMIEECGAYITADDLCTGSRLHVFTNSDLENEDPINVYSESLMNKPVCARTIYNGDGNSLVKQVVGLVEKSQSKGVIAHVIKFCDPYLNRIPAVKSKLMEKNIPLLLIEGDCTVGSYGQFRTRIEAFLEMLKEV